MRLSKLTERRMERIVGREMSMTGWEKIGRRSRKKYTDCRLTQKNMSSGIGHHMPRMMKGHI